jgi:uncharacterized protein YegP (UPF0339 family)
VTELVIVIGKTVDEKYYFRVKTSDGNIMLTSRDYVQFEKCINEIYRLQQYRDFKLLEEFERDNGHKYTLTSASGRTVAESPFYTYLYGMKNDMEMLKKMIGKAQLVDNSSLVRFFRPARIK